MINNNIETSRNNTGAIQKLESLKIASQSLNNALLKRDPDEIFAAVSEQENIVKDLQLSLRAEIEAGTLTAEGARSEAKTLIMLIHQQQRASKAIATSFLNAVDKTLKGLYAKAGNHIVTYNSTGGLGDRTSSMLIHQTG